MGFLEFLAAGAAPEAAAADEYPNGAMRWSDPHTWGGSLPASREAVTVDVGRTLDPGNNDLFTWWAPWRNLKQRNIGWRIDYVLATASVGATATRAECQREFGTSDHAPLVVEFG